jgi:hypothetical protein
MKTQNCFMALALLALATLNSQLSTAHAQGTAFTYQGQLQNNGSPASGTYALTFSLFNTNTTGVSVAEPVTNNAVVITNGLFTVLIDFGPGVFSGTTNWLQIGVATNGVESFTALTPRQELTPVPNAIYAENANGLSGKLSASQLTSIGNTNGGSGNFFVGLSGNSTMSGYYNTADGYQSFGINTIGYENTAYGFQALDSNASGDNNTAVGYSAMLANNSGSQNTAVGENAMAGNQSGGGNSAFGALALGNNQSGSFNTAIGIYALWFNHGSYNAADGAFALYSASGTSSYNIGLGYQAGYNISTGSSNIDIGNLGVATDTNLIRIGTSQTQTFIAGVITGNGAGLTNLTATTFSGTLSASQLTSIGNNNGGFQNFFVGGSGNSTMTGSDNTAYGYFALYYNASGSNNTANGVYALQQNTSGSANTANGYGALQENTSGSDNTADGFEALYNNTSGSGNVADGLQALFENTSGFENTAIGVGALTFNTNGNYNTAIGAAALLENTSGSNNTANGSYALYFNTSGSANTAIGFDALFANTNGYDNTANGYEALFSNQNGYENTADGYNALYGNTSGYLNVAVGQDSMKLNMVGYENVAVGHLALGNNTNDSELVAIGYHALENDNAYGLGSTGYSGENTAVGFEALQADNLGADNTAVGYNALLNNTYGAYNTAYGVYALYSTTNGDFDLAIGAGALMNMMTGNDDIGIGYNAGNYLTSGYDDIYIGNQGSGANFSNTENSVIRIGDTQTATYLAGTVFANGMALTSDRNAKENFKPVDNQAVLAKVASLPVTEWNYKTDQAGVQHIGPMAQDFQAAFGLDGKDDKHISVVDEGGVALAAIQGLNQKLQDELNREDAENAKLKQQNDLLAERLNQVEAIVKQLAARK